MTVVCFGEALIDFLATPAVTQGGTPVFRQFAGGAPANAAVAVAKLGGRCEFVGMLGEDMFGEFLLQSLRDAGVGVRYVRTTSRAKTALAFVSLDAGGERSFSFYRSPSADMLFRAEDFDPACFGQAGIFHVCSNTLTDPGIAEATLAGMAMARQAGALVSIDLNLRPGLWPDATPRLPVLWRGLAAADIVKLSREELDYLRQDRHSDEEIIAKLLHDARLVLVTDGAAEIGWHVRNGGGVLAALRVDAVDTTAAGDAFIGGLLSCLQDAGIDANRFEAFLADEPALERCLRYASACGAFAVTRHGAFAALPTREQATALLETASWSNGDS